MSLSNAAQANSWNGPEGAHWAASTDRITGRNTALHRLLFEAAAIGETDRVLDVGCGAGETTILAARQASRGYAVGLDLSRPMLERARADQARAELVNLRFEEGDAQVHPLGDGEFDVAVSRFGIMFFADPVAAFANIGRALKPTGRLVFVCPRHMARCEWYTIPISALAGPPASSPPAGPSTPSPNAYEPGMFSLADRERIESVLGAAGFRAVTATSADVPLFFGRDAASAADFFLGTGPVRAILDDPDDAVMTPDAARTALEDALRPHAGPEGVHLGGELWLVTAER
ncbi:class I SAM-dependent methyltransferase [Streptosporangium sp. NPDC049046]|uniref:class I SAM-dependent methyltransferase n=1 Tax=unclassified Streptosporangium TaxID=2632669 RepID=UPI0034463082